MKRAFIAIESRPRYSGAPLKIMKHAALTRTESLVIIGAIAFVGAFKLWPLFAEASRMANYQRQRQCQDNLKELGLAVLQYQQDYEGRFPLARTSATTGWADALKPYGVSGSVLACPEGNDNSNLSSSDYFYNARLSGVSVNKLRIPTMVILGGDGDDNAASNVTLSSLPAAWVKDKTSPANRHVLNNHGGANYVFADGHTQSAESSHISSSPPDNSNHPTFAIR